MFCVPMIRGQLFETRGIGVFYAMGAACAKQRENVEIVTDPKQVQLRDEEMAVVPEKKGNEEESTLTVANGVDTSTNAAHIAGTKPPAAGQDMGVASLVSPAELEALLLRLEQLAGGAAPAVVSSGDGMKLTEEKVHAKRHPLAPFVSLLSSPLPAQPVLLFARGQLTPCCVHRSSPICLRCARSLRASSGGRRLLEGW